MTGDHAKLFHAAAEDLGSAPGCVPVGEPVEAVATDAKTLGPFPWYGVGRCPVGEGGVEGGVEAGNLRDLGEKVDGLLQGGQRRRVVEWSQIGQAGESVQHGVGDDHAVPEVGPAVNDAVSHCVYRRVLADEPAKTLLGLGLRYRRQIGRRLGATVAEEHAELEAARPGVDDQHPFRFGQ